MLLFDLQLFAHKKGVSSTKNGRDSNAQRLGTKMHAGQSCIRTSWQRQETGKCLSCR